MHSQAICQAMCQAIVFHGHTRGQEILHEGPTIETEGGILWYPVVLRLELLYPQKAMQNGINTQIWHHGIMGIHVETMCIQLYLT